MESDRAMKADIETRATPRLRWPQFGLRMLLIVLAVLSVPLGWVAREFEQVRRERKAIAWVEGAGGTAYVYMDNQFCGRVKVVGLNGTQVSDVSPLAELKHVERLWLNNTRVSDLSRLAELKNLKHLDLSKTAVTDLSPLKALKKLESLRIVANSQLSDGQVQELKRALPNCEITRYVIINRGGRAITLTVQN